jgi:hypothetical protein
MGRVGHDLDVDRDLPQERGDERGKQGLEPVAQRIGKLRYGEKPLGLHITCFHFLFFRF